MFRSEADLIMGFNCLALAIAETQSRLLAEAFMTTHYHRIVQTDDYAALQHKDRYAYTRYFNAKYCRSGSLGEPRFFFREVEGAAHRLVALNYVLRQGLHHGLATTPFGYRHCSANSFFREELGKDYTPDILPQHKCSRYLPHLKKLPPGYRMTSAGLIVREDVIDTSYVEQEYHTPRNFSYQMNRLSNDSIIREQAEENDTAPVTLESIEKGVCGFDLKAALLSEQGRIDTSHLSDLEMCHIIDDIYLPEFTRSGEGQSIYTLTASRRADLGNMILADNRAKLISSPFNGRRTTPAQLRRCLAL